MTETEEQFERELGRALTRVDAPGTLVGLVMERVAAKRPRVLEFHRLHVWMGSVAASLLLAGLLFGGVEHHRAAERAGAERARAERDFARSLEITDRAMDQTRRQLQQAGIALDE